MAIKFYVVPEKKQVIAVMQNTRDDAYNKAIKVCRNLGFYHHAFIGPDYETMQMPNQFKVVVTCHPDDVFDIEEGKKKAKARVLKNYYASFDKRMDEFYADLKHIADRSVKAIANRPDRSAQNTDN
jgi:predicted deacetylase